MLGEAEKNKFQVFCLEYNDPEKRKIFSTENNEKLTAPPHNQINKKGNIEWLWVSRTDISDDWHTAYQPVIDALKRQQLPKYPAYPSHTDDLFEHGAYWEGAVYYLKTVLNYNSESDYIHYRLNKTTRWEEFEIIYNSKGQLHLLDAHMARVALSELKSEMLVKTVKNCNASLRDIKLLYNKTPYSLQNPYFGGNNPLHLTLLKHLKFERPDMS